jgi:hypothetical protein
MFGLEKFLSPVIGLKVVKANLEEAINLKLNNFDIIFNNITKEISFRVYVENKIRLYPYADGQKLADIIQYNLKSQVPEGCDIDVTIICYSDAPNDEYVKAELYYTKDGLKQIHKIEL